MQPIESDRQLVDEGVHLAHLKVFVLIRLLSTCIPPFTLFTQTESMGVGRGLEGQSGGNGNTCEEPSPKALWLVLPSLAVFSGILN